MTIVSLYRKESFNSHGLTRKNIISAIISSALCMIPYLLFVLVTQGNLYYFPFHSVYTTKELLSSHFPINVVGIGLLHLYGFLKGLIIL